MFGAAPAGPQQAAEGTAANSDSKSDDNKAEPSAGKEEPSRTAVAKLGGVNEELLLRSDLWGRRKLARF
jgi:hypothetical protein